MIPFNPTEDDMSVLVNEPLPATVKVDNNGSVESPPKVTAVEPETLIAVSFVIPVLIVKFDEVLVAPAVVMFKVVNSEFVSIRFIVPLPVEPPTEVTVKFNVVFVVAA